MTAPPGRGGVAGDPDLAPTRPAAGSPRGSGADGAGGARGASGEGRGQRRERQGRGRGGDGRGERAGLAAGALGFGGERDCPSPEQPAGRGGTEPAAGGAVGWRETGPEAAGGGRGGGGACESGAPAPRGAQRGKPQRASASPGRRPRLIIPRRRPWRGPRGAAPASRRRRRRLPPPLLGRAEPLPAAASLGWCPLGCGMESA